MEEFTGIILKKISYKENSEIMYLYTGKGLVGVLIHGSKTMKSPHLNFAKVLNHVKVFASGKNLKVFRDGEVIEKYSSLVDNLEKYTYLLHALEMVYYFSSHDHDHEKLLSFLLKMLKTVKAEEDYIPYINMLELKMLYLLGVNPNWNDCLVCQEKNDLVLSIKDGSAVCKKHLSGDFYNSQVLNILKNLYYFDLKEEARISFDKSYFKAIRNAIDDYYEYHLNYHSKTRKMLEGLIGY